MTKTDQNFFAPTDGVERFIACVVSTLSEEVALKDLLPSTGIAFNTLARNFRNSFGITPMHWVWALRTVTAAAMLAEISMSNITSISFYCGFSSSSHFSRKFSSVFKTSPSQFRKFLRDNTLSRADKKLYLESQVKDRYLPVLPLIIESISKNTTIITIYNPNNW